MSLTWENLKENAKKILECEPTGDYCDVSFKTNSGGIPNNTMDLPVVHVGQEYRYNTSGNGSAYSGEIVLRCRETDAKDLDGRTIYEHENGTLFVWYYRPGNPHVFDGGAIISPKLKEL